MPQFPLQWRSKAGGHFKEGAEAARDGADDAPADAGAVLAFEPERVARAIVFHMLDEGLASEVTAESVKRMVVGCAAAGCGRPCGARPRG